MSIVCRGVLSSVIVLYTLSCISNANKRSNSMVFDKNLIYCSFVWCRCQPLTEWCVIGAEEGDLVPHLVVVVGGVPSCPFAIPRGTERHSLTVVFPAAPEASAQQTLVMTCQQIDGQTHVLLWDQPCPQVIVHNHTHSTVMFAKANTDNASTFFYYQNRLMLFCIFNYFLKIKFLHG